MMPDYASPFTREEREELAGLPKLINQALTDHPGWDARPGRIAACKGPGCHWHREPQRGSTDYQFRRHQTHMIRDAVGKWFFENTDPVE